MNRFVRLYQSVRERLGDGSLNPFIQVKAQSKSQNGFRSRAKIRDFELIIDQPRGFEGENMGPKPSEVLLAALAACQEVTWRLYGEAYGISISDVRVDLVGTQDLRGFMGIDDTIPAGFQKITGTVTISSPASEDDIIRLQKIVDQHCPVLDDLRRPLDVSLNIEVEPEAAAGE